MQITDIHIKNFRCFQDLTVQLKAPLVLILGNNGVGKTSLLEVLHYGCYLRSFRTHLPRELVAFDREGFFFKIKVKEDLFEGTHEVQVGFNGKKKLIKIDQRAVESYKELTEYYRVITLTEDDLLLIKGGPDMRRLFLDQALVLMHPELMAPIKAFRKILVQRQALLQQNVINHDSYTIWTEKLWQSSRELLASRVQLLHKLQERVNTILQTEFHESIRITLTYSPKGITNLEVFDPHALDDLYRSETFMKRSLFGAHLDDFSISFQEQSSKKYASRGQQKLTLVLLKIAQLQEMHKSRGTAIFLLDDFMTDFDPGIIEKLLGILKDLSLQLIFTSPGKGRFEEQLLLKGAQLVSIDTQK